MKALLLILIRAVARLHLRASGVRCGRRVICNGLCPIRRKGSGTIVVGDDVQINAARWANWLGTTGSMMLSVEDGATLELSEGCGISLSHLVANDRIVVGKRSIIGVGCLLCDSDMHDVPLHSGRPIAVAPILIGEDVFIGAHCLILKGVQIGDGAVIGAGSVVTRSVPPRTMVAGNPARTVSAWSGIGE